MDSGIISLYGSPIVADGLQSNTGTFHIQMSFGTLSRNPREMKWDVGAAPEESG